MTARTDLNNIGGTIDAANSLFAIAGRDLNVVTTTSSASNYTEGTTVNNFSHTGIDRVAGLYVTGSNGGTLVASAGRDVNIIAGIIANNGASGATVIVAQRDLNLGTVGTSSSSSIVRGVGTDFLEDRQSADVGSQINVQGNLTLQAGQDLNAKAANVQAGGELTAVAGNNINITNGQQTNSASFGMTSSDGDLFSSTSSTERRSGEQSNALGSSIGGNTVTAVAGNNLTVTGSSIISDTGTVLSAGNNLTIQAATNTSSSSEFKETKESGLMSSGGYGVTIGSLEQSVDQKSQGATAAASTVGSIGGDVTLLAGNAYKQVGSDVMAPGGDITIAAKSVDIVEARETSQTTVEQKFKQEGLTLEVTSPIISAMQTAQQMSEAADNTSDGRMKDLAAANTAFAASKAYDAIQKGQLPKPTGGNNPSANTDVEPSAAEKAGGIDLAISIGGSESQSRQDTESLVKQYGSGAGPAAAAIRTAILGNARNEVFTDDAGNTLHLFTNITVGRGGSSYNPGYFNDSSMYSQYLPITAQGINEFSRQFGYAPPLSPTQLASLDSAARSAYGTALGTQIQRETGGIGSAINNALQAIGQAGVVGTLPAAAAAAAAAGNKGISGLDDIGPLRPPARPLLTNEGVLVDASLGLQSSKSGPFTSVKTGQYPEASSKYLYTVDSRGVNILLEATPFPTPRGNVVHTNISSQASIGGEAWFGPNNTVTINAGSGRFGDAAGVTPQQWQATIKYWESLGYKVNPITFGSR